MMDDIGPLQRYGIDLEVSVDVRDVRLAEGAEEAAKFSEEDVREAIARGLAQQLDGGASEIELEVVDVEEDPDRDDALTEP